MGPQLRISTRILLVLMIFGFGLIAMHDDRTVRHLMRAVRDEAEWQQHGKDAANTAKVFTREVNANYRPLFYDLNSAFTEKTSPSTDNGTTFSIGWDGETRTSDTGGYGQVHRLMAIASFSMDQLVVGCNQFATFVMAGVAWDRDVVIPQIQGSHYTGLAGSHDVKMDRRYSKSNSSLPRKMDDYFNLEYISNHLRKHHLKLIPQTEALEVCNGQWSILYLIPLTLKKHSPYGFSSAHRTQHFRNSWHSTMDKLKASEESPLAIEKDCDWLLEGMPTTIHTLAPFSKIVCAAVPSRIISQRTMLEVAQIINSLSSRCLLISHWFGPLRHGFLHRAAPPMVWFKAAWRIQDAVRRAIARSSLREGFTALHVRSEYVYTWCKASTSLPHNCQPSNVSFQIYFRQCADEALRTIAPHPSKQPLLLTFDLRSESLLSKGKRALLQPEELILYLYSNLGERFANITELDDFVAQQFADEANSDLVSNNGMRALLDAEILVQASSFFGIGGGNFQNRIIELRQSTGETISCQNLTIQSILPSQ